MNFSKVKSIKLNKADVIFAIGCPVFSDYFYVPNLSNWQKKILSLFGISETKLIDSNKYRHIKARNVLALEHPWYKKGLIQEGVNNIPEWIVLFLRERFINKAKKFKIKNYDIYVVIFITGTLSIY